MLRYADCTYVIGKGCYADLSDCRSIMNEGTLYAFSSLKNYMYYAVGSTVYRVDLSADRIREEEQFTLPGEEITCLKFNLYQNAENAQRSYDLLVGTASGGEGKLRIYEDAASDGDFSKVEPVVYDGFAKIKDITYKERIY